MEIEQYSSSWRRGTRWYFCEISKDLFDNYLVRRAWGDIISRRGGGKEHICQSLEEAKKLYAYVIKRRTQRGYQNKPI